MPKKVDKFIQTEPIESTKLDTDGKVWEAIKEAFKQRDCMGFWKYPIFSKTGQEKKEPDILLVDKELGLIIIDIKPITIDQVVAINEDIWQLQNFHLAQENPYAHTENALYAIRAYCDREKIIRHQVGARAIIALPLISQTEWQQKGFEQLPNCPPIIFQEQLASQTLLESIQQAKTSETGTNLNDEQWEILLTVIGGTTILRKNPVQAVVISPTGKTRSTVIQQLRDRLYELDTQQTKIGMQIPPGVQQIRGIAGSGKTVLLCQKAVNMHLKHPDWDIALVFFTRSLYNQIEELVDKWMRYLSCGEIGYKQNRQAMTKLKILHAWGGKDRDGFYQKICQENRQKPLAVRDTEYRKPNEGLADLCKRLMQTKEIKPMFDAVLIDEGQDLVVDAEDLKYEEKEVIYWMAYQSLRPCDPEHPQQRRLILAYDEAQSLDTVKIPKAKELFGSNDLFDGFFKGYHKGGIGKSEVMRRCYRTPAPILTAAHAIGMGLLREEGMLSGFTTKKDWNGIGYKAEGDFRSNNLIVLERPPENSPNPLPEIWQEPVLNFNIYDSRQDELTALAENITYNIVHDGLEASRQILVVVLGSTNEAINLETYAAEFLIDYGIDIFVPSAKELNQLNPKYPENNPDAFWHLGGVTISRIHRAKGNEADMVYVIGFDNVAKNESSITLRNQVFVGLTRSRGWTTLSGIGYYPMYEEMQKVIASGNRFEFYNKRPKRNMNDEDMTDEATIS